MEFQEEQHPSRYSWSSWKTLGRILAVLAILVGGFGVWSWLKSTAIRYMTPEIAFQTYERFSETLDLLRSMRLEIEATQMLKRQLKYRYGPLEPWQWAPVDRDAWSRWTSDLEHQIGEYNVLAARYNAGMAQTGWLFAPDGVVPESLSAVVDSVRTSLPREMHLIVPEAEKE